MGTKERDEMRAADWEAAEEEKRMRRDLQVARFEVRVMAGQRDERATAVRERSAQVLSLIIVLNTAQSEIRLTYQTVQSLRATVWLRETERDTSEAERDRAVVEVQQVRANLQE